MRGNSSLQEAFRRVLDEEVTGALDIPYGHSLTDIEGYYDNIVGSSWFGQLSDWNSLYSTLP